MYYILRYTVLPWLKATYPDNNYVWQQNEAAAHTSKKVQKFCSTNIASFWSKEFWPLSSSDLKPLDYFWWCTIESKTNHTSHGNLDSLKAAIARKWNDFAKENIRRAYVTFRGCIRSCIVANKGKSSENVQNACTMCSSKFQTKIPENTKVILN